MASFDIFCEPHMGCVKAAVAEVRDLIPQRYDWKDTDPSIQLSESHIILSGVSHQQLNQMLKELCYALKKQLVSLTFITVRRPTVKAGRYTARLKIERGITKEWADYLIKTMKSFCIPAKYSHQNGEVHVVTGHIDDAQQLIAQMRLQKFDIPIHYRNLLDE